MSHSNIAKQFEVCAIFACLAGVLYLMIAYLSQHAYEQMAWLALGQRGAEPWKEMRDIAFFGMQRGLRYFLAFLFIGLLYICFEEVRTDNFAGKIVLSMLVAPIALGPLLFYITTREFAGSTVWSLWAIYCGLFYWQAKLNMSSRIDIVVWVLLGIFLASLAKNDLTLWNFAFEKMAREIHGEIEGARRVQNSQGYFLAAEALYIAGQIVFAYALPRKMLREIVTRAGER